jgi:putative endonuclease
MRRYQFWTYILTNYNRTVLYTGITNHLARRLVEHWIGAEGAFTSRYNVYYLLFAEETKYVLNAIDREKEIKLLTRRRKEGLIATQNPEWIFMNERVLGNWPPTKAPIKDALAFWDEQYKVTQPDNLFFHKQIRSENIDDLLREGSE